MGDSSGSKPDHRILGFFVDEALPSRSWRDVHCNQSGTPVSPLSDAIRRQSIIPLLAPVKVHRRSPSDSMSGAGSDQSAFGSSGGIPIPGSRSSWMSSYGVFNQSQPNWEGSVHEHHGTNIPAPHHLEETVENEDEELQDAPDLGDQDLFLLEIPEPAVTLPFKGILRIKTGKTA